ncbi:hypothetical protein CEXT_96681 [Caerostris extrusa]|uniref:Uncharacterized protein n=1 Tax=Caerostris extrusa TaxID=172846 RepID=A0AAV4RL89_CAEEX|nr:hypothetical protein CEXT_96681 [Caerostris extrusa]
MILVINWICRKLSNDLHQELGRGKRRLHAVKATFVVRTYGVVWDHIRLTRGRSQVRNLTGLKALVVKRGEKGVERVNNQPVSRKARIPAGVN